jgi:hypothetical protein
MMNTRDPVRWLLASRVVAIKVVSTAVAGTIATIKTRPALAKQHIDLGPHEILTSH